MPTVATAKGPLQTRQASALLARRWARATPDMKALAIQEEAATGVPLIAGNKVTLLIDGPATMKEMMAAVRDAKTTVNLETYIFDQDELGMQFADLLIEKRRQGVRLGPPGFRVRGDDLDQAQRLGADVTAYDFVALQGIVAVVEHQIEHVEDRGQARQEHLRLGHGKGNPLFPDAPLGAYEALRHRALFGQKGAGDFTHVETADRLQRQRNPRVGRNLGVATGEDHAQLIVGNLARQNGLGHVRELYFHQLDDLVRGVDAPGAAARPAKRGIAGDGKEPAAWIFRNATERPMG